jgi:hypothetical protein
MSSVLTITHGGGSINYDRWWRITEDSLEFDVKSSRPPLSDVWFRHGTLKQSSGRLGILLTPTLRDEAATNAQISALLSALPSVSSISVDGRARSVYGVTSQSVSPTEFGMAIQAEFHCREGDWAQGAATPWDREFGLRLTGSVGTLHLMTDYPSESQNFQRSIEMGLGGMVEKGDLKWNPTSLIVRARAIGASQAQAWATMVRICNIARTITSLTLNGNTINIFGCKRMSRSYVGYTKINIELEFLPASRIYPLDISRLLQEDFFLLEQEDSSAILLE